MVIKAHNQKMIFVRVAPVWMPVRIRSYAADRHQGLDLALKAAVFPVSSVSCRDRNKLEALTSQVCPAAKPEENGQ
jgi:hypothetical protein